MPGPRSLRVVLVTAPNGRVAQGLARALVEQRLAACVNVIPRIESHYRWEGRLCRDAESLLLIKTSSRLMPALLSFVKARHPYKLPEVIGLAIAEGSPAYLDWLKGCLARPSLILASASPQRRRLLKRLGLAFRVLPSRVPEESAETNPRRLVLALARRKALAVARRHPRALVLGADTVVVCKGEILGKPRDRGDSERILGLLNGRWQSVYTGVALAMDGGRRIIAEAALSRVLARRLSPKALRTLAGKHMDKAGAYAVQDRDDPFIARVEGDLDNVIGLPLKAVRRLLKKAARAARAATKAG